MPIIDLQRKLYEATGADAATVDIAARIIRKDDMLVTYGGAPVDKADYSIAVDTPAAGQTRLTFAFTVAAGEKVKVYA